MEGNQISLQWNQNAQDVGYGRQHAQPQPDVFFHPLDCEPTLQIGYAWPSFCGKKSNSTIKKQV